MSWECNDCHTIATGNAIRDAHFSFSHGACETCGRVRDCADCHCHGRWAEAREAALVASPKQGTDATRS